MNAIPGGDGDAGDPPGSPSRGQGASPTLVGVASPPADTGDEPPASSGMSTRAPDAGAPEEPPGLSESPPSKPCPTDQERCGGACVKVAEDRANCGACGKACAGSQLCVKGTCRCKDDQLLCGLLCIAPKSDVLNCGGCGILCVGKKCHDGKCEGG